MEKYFHMRNRSLKDFFMEQSLKLLPKAEYTMLVCFS